MQIRTFWKQLDWPEVEDSYAFISKILDVSPLANDYAFYLFSLGCVQDMHFLRREHVQKSFAAGQFPNFEVEAVASHVSAKYLQTASFRQQIELSWL